MSIRRWMKRNPEQDVLDLPLLKLSSQDEWTVRDALEGTLILGGSGSGKTSGPGLALAHAMLGAGFGGLVLTAKPDERERWLRHAAATNRTKSVVILSPSSGHRFNFLAHAAQHAPQGAQTEALVRLMSIAAEAADRGTGGGAGGGGSSDPYWMRACQQLLRNGFDALRLADEDVSIAALMRLVNDAPQSAQQLATPGIAKMSFLLRCLQTAEMLAISDQDRGDIDATIRFWCSEFPALASRTRSSIVSTFTTMADGFVRGELRTLLCTDSTIDLRWIEQGAIVIADLPTLVHGESGRIAQTVLKHVFQTMLESRDVTQSPRPCFLWADEAQQFITGGDADYQAVCRSARAATVYITQSVPSLVNAVGGKDARSAVDSLLSNLRTKILCGNNDPDTNDWSERLLAKSWQQRVSTQQQDRSSGNDPNARSQQSTGSSAQESLDPEVLAQEFLTLRSGGPRHQYEIDCLLTQGGRVFRSTGKHYARLTFRQQPA